ncbi:MBL fold metallo-hydrolase [Haloarcula onubensis]|uniref:MBL fold metallo-hydrolase n=1 Tax=Haloarcula onubensis TaxID=2950539 RepID=A0ABU2FLM4_9EURY|nr:MBL fold metallo-hydrolase [Halomicroarcula sp. S3CR25-11]MDS0281671.1 MBL fold metallo-hydrolase [Halomicroarcula sp. S3CR25-11]
MSDKPFPIPDDVTSIDPSDLYERLDDGEQFGVLDTRAPADVDDWRIDGDSVAFANVPYYQFLDGVPESALDQLPEARPLYTVCAKGLSSKFVADVLDDAGVDDVVAVEDGMEGWETVLASTELAADTDATVVQFYRPSSGCLSYLVVSDGEAVVVDPLHAFAEEYVDAAQEYGADLVAALDTHVHADHISGVRTLAREYGVRAVVPDAAESRGIDYEEAYDTLGDGETVAVGDVAVEAVHTPGHTTGMTSYLVADAVLLTGDGLFVESVARPDLEDGAEGAPEAARQLYDTLQERVLALPDETLVAPGHVSDGAEQAPDGSFTDTLGDIAASMPALSRDRESFVEFVLADMPPRPENYEDIIATNLGHEPLDDDTAAELERGPNNCAATTDAMTGQ